MSGADATALFDRSREYDAMLARGLRLSGESKEYFLAGRVADLAHTLGQAFRPRRVLDFGCGIGDGSARLAEVFPEAEVVGIDTAAGALDHARATFGGPRVRFASIEGFGERDAFDLCYANGVFHHIRPEERPGALAMILSALAPGGRFALFENNYRNPGTRQVMRRIPFDRDAVPVSAAEARRMLAEAGFAEVTAARFLFWFPRPLAFLRPLEPALVRVPLGAQYWVMGSKPAAGSARPA